MSETGSALILSSASLALLSDQLSDVYYLVKRQKVGDGSSTKTAYISKCSKPKGRSHSVAIKSNAFKIFYFKVFSSHALKEWFTHFQVSENNSHVLM